MDQQMRQHRCTIGHHLGLCLALALGLTLGTRAATARECHRETPLQADVRLIAPGPQVPEAVARFAGVWTSTSAGPEGSDTPCHTLVVEEVFANGYARIIFSLGTAAGVGLQLPWFLRATGRVVDGVLRLQLPILAQDRPKLTYQFVGEGLEGLTRVTDLPQVGCGPPADGPPPAPPATGPRDRLTADELRAPAAVGAGPVHNAYFLPVGQAAPALHGFKGTLTIQASTISRTRHGCTGLPVPLPAFTAAFFTQGEHLVPVVRDIVDPPGIILSPGRVWSEPGDGGMSRAAFPFVLTNPFDNRTHHGLATFLYDDTRVSALRLQVIQEIFMEQGRYDGWGQASMTYTPGSSANEDALRTQFATESQQQTPIRPWSALPAAAGAPSLEGFDGDTAPEALKASGLIINGIVYLRGCPTRYGPYPYCQHTRYGAFSITKSLGAAVALLRLAQTYGDQVFALKIKDYVTVTAAHDGWERVTFADALNMTTGIGDNSPQREPNNITADEMGQKTLAWFRARTAKDKLDVAFSAGKYPWGPGEVARYNTIHTFVLAAAMDGFLKRQVGPQAHLWEMVAAEVFQPIGIVHAPMMHTQEADGGRGIPHLGHGLYPTLDDLAKLTTLLQNGGQHQGQQLLHAAKLAEALYKTEAMGLPNSLKNRFGEGRYHLSFWSMPYRTANGCVFQIPHMRGFLGNLVVLLPNGISAFRFADGGNYDIDTMVLAGEALRPFPCPSGPGEVPHQRQPLSASEVHAELPGHTFYRNDWHMFLAAGGVLYGAVQDDIDIGTWRMTPEGQLCRTWHVWGGRRERCYAVYREGETFTLELQERWGQEVLRRVPGNAEGY